MKRTSAILCLLFFCIQAIAKQDLFPPTMLGYYEGAGMGLYLDRDGLRMIDLGMTADSESRSMRDPHFYTLSDQGLLLKKKGEVNGISTYSTISQGKHQHSLLIEFLSSTSLKMKIDQSPWKEFDREEIQIEHYQKLFKLKDELEKELFVEQLLLPQGFKSLTKSQHLLRGFGSLNFNTI